MSNKIEYDTILSLVKKQFKKIMIMHDSWNTWNGCVVNIIKIRPDGKRCNLYGYINMQMQKLLSTIQVKFLKYVF